MAKLIKRYTLFFLIFWIGFTLRSQYVKINDLVAEQYNIQSIEATLIAKKAELMTSTIGLTVTELEKPYLNLLVAYKWGTRFFSGEAKEEYKRLKERLEELPGKMEELSEKKTTLEQEINTMTEQLRQLRKRDSLIGRLTAIGILLYTGLSIHWGNALGWTFYLFLLSVIWKISAYYLIAPLIEKMRTINLFEKEEPSETQPVESADKGKKLITLMLQPGESITVRDESYSGGYTDYRDGQLIKRTCWIFSLRYLIMSWLCGLYLMTRFTHVRPDGTPHELIITSDDPDEYFTVITLRKGDKRYITPSELVAYSDSIQLKAHWRFFSLVAWCMGQVRYYILSGEGQVVLKSEGGITASRVSGTKCCIRKKHSVIYTTEGVKMHIRRTETFAPYFLGRTGLFDLRMQGNGFFYMRNAAVKPTTLTDKIAYTFLEGIGKFFGF